MSAFIAGLQTYQAKRVEKWTLHSGCLCAPCDFILLMHKWSVSSGQLQVAMSYLCGSFQQVPLTHYRTPMPKSTTMDGNTMDGFLLCYGVGLASSEGCGFQK